VPKDFKDSWKQHSWEFAVESYERQKRMLELATKLSSPLAERIKNQIAELEQRYPQRKKQMS
jgi:hypothetical protein